MRDFYLVQRGTFTKNVAEGSGLTGCKGIVEFAYMGSSEFQFGAIPKSFRRIMWDYKWYDIYSTGIKTPDGKMLKIFSRRDRSYKTIKAIREFIDQGWELQERSYLEHVMKGENLSKRVYFTPNFWWCIDIPHRNNLSDWMAFFAEDEEKFKAAIENDYNEWWLKMSEEEREKEYRKSLIR